MVEDRENWDTFEPTPRLDKPEPENLNFAVRDFRSAVYRFASMLAENRKKGLLGPQNPKEFPEQFRRVLDLGRKLPKKIRDENLADLKAKFPHLPIEEI
ncbi:MAG: hypothetical protein HY397_02430 [Candidatus Doudnabacteria bacterium]|nr:hypothetical protein [Candidatus Doudnabacteria bacterium]